MDQADPGALVARILNCCYLVRHYQRPVARAQRAEAIAELGRAVRAALAASRDDEAILYAVAIGLYQPSDKRFTV